MKQTCIIIVITLALLSFIETASWVYRQCIGREHTGLFFARGAGHDISDPCNLFIFDLQLGYIHDQTTGCTARGAEILPGFVHYFTKPSTTKPVRIVTLGGSTTDGILSYVDGYNWPYWLNQICNTQSKSSTCDVYNGGVGGFSSSRELRKLFRDVLVLKPQASIIISLNGENDVTNEDGPLGLKYPYYDADQLMVLDHQRFPPAWDNIELFPNTIRMLRKFMTSMGFTPLKNIRNCEMVPNGPAFIKARLLKEKARQMNAPLDAPTITRMMEIQPISKKYAAVLPQANFLNDNGDLWKRNVELMHGIAQATGAQYLVFVQPVMGLREQDSRLMGDNDKKLFATLDPSYIEDLNNTFDLIRKACKTLDYCVDISDLLAEKGKGQDVYHDIRHQNALSTKIIATRVFEEIRKRGLISQ